MMNIFPRDFDHTLTGFGGDPAMNRAQHRDALKHTPVILIHGNATNSADPKFGMQTIKEFLKDPGHGLHYQDCEIWAMDYLGENNTSPDLQNGVHRRHIEALRTFIDNVVKYLGVKKIDIITHSLGCTMTQGYLRGLQADGGWNNDNNRFDVVSTVVCLAGGLHGLGANTSIDEFKTGGDFQNKWPVFRGVKDETVSGSNDTSKQFDPPDHEDWKQVTSLDNNAIAYVALTAHGDFIDQQNIDTGHLAGADLNKRYDLGALLQGHEAIVKTLNVFDDFKIYLNQNPPKPPVSITVDKESGNFGSDLQVTVTVEPSNVPVHYTAQRVTKAFNAGFIVETVAEKKAGDLSNAQSLTLTPDGEWDVVFSAEGTEDVTRTYGANVPLPEVRILTDNGTPFKGSLVVEASTSKGTLFVGFDGKHWNADAKVTINKTSKVYFIAIDQDGLASPIVSRSFEKAVVPSATGTLTEHFIAGRLTVTEYIDLGGRLGYTVSVTLYQVDGKWVLNPDTPSTSARAPVIDVSDDSGVFANPITLALGVRHDTDPAPKVHYTLDGSTPTQSSPSFASSGLLKLDTPGDWTIKLRAVDAHGNWSDVETKTYKMNIKAERPEISANQSSGQYPQPFDVVLNAADDKDKSVTVYYTTNGSDPSHAANPDRHSFVGSKTLSIHGNGNHAVFCYAKNSAGKETFESFAWRIA